MSTSRAAGTDQLELILDRGKFFCVENVDGPLTRRNSPVVPGWLPLIDFCVTSKRKADGNC
ncbi:hypothetical protein J6590_069808 [Homalodisca vitripennis]|nr:hypothetical protein J6590_069808 [Homalodisca vitripennis]